MALKILVHVLAVFAILIGNVSAEEFRIDGTSGSRLDIGDFRCSYCPNSSHSVLEMGKVGPGQVISTGLLWQFFNKQGVDSLSTLTFCLDVDLIDSDTDLCVNSVQIEIENPNEAGLLITNAGFGEHSLLVRGYETTSFKPEAKFELALGYDFMKTFSASSTEKLTINFETEGDVAMGNPVMLVQSGTGGFFLTGRQSIWLLSFAAFWLVVFSLLNRFTKPKTERTPNAPTLATSLPTDS